MKNTAIILSILLFTPLFASGAAAFGPDDVMVSSDHEWLVAGSETATISAVVNNSVPVTQVEFMCVQNSVYGDVDVTYDFISPYSTTFSTEKSGTADIMVRVSYDEGEGPNTIEKIYSQKIDHALPYAFSRIDVPNEVTVATETPLTVALRDIYGNTVDNRNQVESVTLECYYPDAGFRDGSEYINRITREFGADGNATVMFLSGSQAGSNIILFDTVSSVVDRWLVIQGVGEAMPAAMSVDVIPASLSAYADGSDSFVLTYTVSDRFGNPSPNSPVEITTSLNERKTVLSNRFGQATIQYGPKTTIGTVEITARSTLNASVVNTIDVTFTSEEGISFDLCVNPTTLASLDVKPFVHAEVRARVVDLLGRGVAGETVDFSINEASIWNSTVLNETPVLSSSITSPVWQDSVTLVTDSDGYAIAYFRPGGFPVLGEPGYDPFSRGNCTVTVTWDGRTSETSPIAWRNYPYLRLETAVSESTIRVGEPFNITIKAIGDGHELNFRYPIDAVLTTARSATMFTENDDRMVEAFRAQEAFIDVLEGSAAQGGTDRVGIVSFAEAGTPDLLDSNAYLPSAKKLPGADGTETDNAAYIAANYNTTSHTYTADTTVDVPITSGLSLAAITSAAYDTQPWSVTDTKSSPLRNGLYTAIREIIDNPRSNSVRAVVVLLDSSFKWYGDPLAKMVNQAVLPAGTFVTQGTGQIGGPWYVYPDLPFDAGTYDSATSLQNMSYYALSNDIRIYIVTVGSTQIEWNNQPELDAMDEIATSTGGLHYHAESAAELNEKFEEVAQALVRYAGVDTTMNLDFVSFDDPQDAITWSAADLLEYQPMTSIDYYNWTVHPDTPVFHHTGYPQSVNQTHDWLGIAPPVTNLPAGNLYFALGDIRVKETWKTTFGMKVNASVDETLNFSLFGPNTMVSFENKDGQITSLPLPEIFITIVPPLNATPLNNSTLALGDLALTDLSPEVATFAWNMTYSGNMTVSQDIKYMTPNGIWKPITPLPVRSSGGWAEEAYFWYSDLPPAQYVIRVTADSDDAGTGTIDLIFTVPPPNDRAYIRIE